MRSKVVFRHSHAVGKLHHVDKVQVIALDRDFLARHHSHGADSLNDNRLGVGELCDCGKLAVIVGNNSHKTFLWSVFRHCDPDFTGHTGLYNLNARNRRHTRNTNLTNLVKIASDETQLSATHHGTWSESVKTHTVAKLVGVQIVLATACQRQPHKGYHQQCENTIYLFHIH